MADTICRLEGALVQHGPDNHRVYLMDLGEANPETLLPRIASLAEQEGYSKLFAKIPSSHAPVFLAHGYTEEARVPHLYEGTEDGCFMSRFLDSGRRVDPHWPQCERVLRRARAEAPPSANPPATALPRGARCGVCDETQVEAMAALYDAVFASYPFPIHRPDYLLKTMRSHVMYVGIWFGDDLAALASAEMDTAHGNAELTDFATSPAYRGRGLARHLLARMEGAMRERGILAAYTIARAASFGMNIVFARRAFAYGGSLINNTDIGGQLESMHVWYRWLAE